MFPLQEIMVSDRFSEIKVEVGASFLFVKKLFKSFVKLLTTIRFSTSSTFETTLKLSKKRLLTKKVDR